MVIYIGLVTDTYGIMLSFFREFKLKNIFFRDYGSKTADPTLFSKSQPKIEIIDFEIKINGRSRISKKNYRGSMVRSVRSETYRYKRSVNF